MSPRLTVAVEGIGAWAPGAPDWQTLGAILRGESALRGEAPLRPAANALPAAERRRAPDAVLLAAEVAAQAVAMARRDPATLACVFASTEGELEITDYMCATLARAPVELSPTKFHNSVHNAPVGYWTIAGGVTAASSAVSAYHATLAAGLLEAAALAVADAIPVLFAAYDIAAVGPLAEMARISRPFGMALVLAPGIRDNDARSIVIDLRPGEPDVPSFASHGLNALAADNTLSAHALALLAALATDAPRRLALPVAAGLLLDMEVRP